MKKRFLLMSALALMGTVMVISCGKDKPVTSDSNAVATTKDGAVFTVDTLNSKVEWTGYKIFKSDNTSHFGSIKFESGEVTVKDNKLESGNFVASMNTLTAEDLKDNKEDQGKLNGHLKSGDFFEVDKFPTASYEITKVTANETGDYNTLIDGNLTLKGVTKPVSFNTNVVVKDGVVTIKSEKKDINRRDFGVNFTSPASNGVVKDEVSLQINVKALEKR
ncbi:YceI family protein [Elizabethkingia meningoseptica]|uniref:YceI family protein n=1 Tax=Elizabethkingia meningoseptica TaxID=238 RepID=UPI000332C531|nr:YceI family protein [Elizabethkingia meningoseptica]AQX06647.1 polyisoprenoid-binding protein [Elizabethkingia meningoseptica]AQX48695.1 polyisoprenoid-binding protein [Elizabethkingia meningoseptica]EJK5328260.1 YceI family protein [Elizabethkingia meningoseptica]EOR28546.1 Rhodanese-like domain protein [Elizabethkingia meningoseptica ATCC 13253 = NBRC 12535]KUY22384.1 polyisoprenoid-binding protein [Elizabethkingia meningoseptica]